MRDRWFAYVLVSIPCACSSTEDPGAEPAESNVTEGGSLEAGVAGSEFVFRSGDYELGPGEEKYICWTTELPADSDSFITKVWAEYGPGTHHIFLGWTLSPEPEGLSECPVLFKTTWIPLYLGGVNTSPLQMPDGAAIEMGRGKQLVMQLHIQNTSTETVTNRVTAYLELGDAQQSYTPAGIFGLDNHDIAIPPISEGTETSMTCQPGKQMEVFSVLGHMHKLGKDYRLEHNGEVVFEQTWLFDEQPITPFEMSVSENDTLALYCRHDNPLPFEVGYGESSDAEMCAIVLYYTPYDRLDGCVHNPNAPAASGDAGASEIRIIGASGACASDEDIAILSDPATSGLIQDCGVSCLGQPTICGGECLNRDAGLSVECGSCYAEMINCTFDNCLDDCAAGPSGPACSDCRQRMCVPAFEGCSGIAG